MKYQQTATGNEEKITEYGSVRRKKKQSACWTHSLEQHFPNVVT
jgi:hypothetical protein